VDARCKFVKHYTEGEKCRCGSPLPAPATVPGKRRLEFPRNVPAPVSLVVFVVLMCLPSETVPSPKSRILIAPSGVRITFSGLRSRWITPCAWAAGVRGQLQHRFRAARILRAVQRSALPGECGRAHTRSLKEISLMLFERKNSGNGGMREGGRTLASRFSRSRCRHHSSAPGKEL